MKIRDIIETINGMQADGVIDTYAIGGAVGATFYLEPVRWWKKPCAMPLW